MAGLWLGDRFPFPATYSVLLLTLVTGYVLFLSSGLYSRLFLWLLLPLLGYGLLNAHQQYLERPGSNTGVLVIQARQYSTSETWIRYEARLEGQRLSGEWYSDDRDILLYVKDTNQLAPGQRLLYKGEITRPDPPLHQYMFDYARYLKFQGIYGQLFLSRSDFVMLNQETDMWIYRRKWQSYVRNKIREWIPDPQHAAILTGMVLGEKRGLGTAVRMAFSVTGSMHILAVSGLHVGLIYGILVFLFSWMPNFSPWPWVRWSLFLLLLLAYAGLANFSPSVIRAVVFVLLYMLARLVHRPNPLWHVLFLTAFVMLLFSPFQMFQVSFQLSFMAVLGILLFMPILTRWFSHRNRIIDYFLKNIAMSVSVQLTTIGLSLYYFHQVSFVFWLSAMLVVPVTFILLLCTMGLFISAGLPVIHAFLVQVVGGLMEFMTSSLHVLADFPGSHLTGVTLPIWLVAPVPVLIYWGCIVFSGRWIRSFWWFIMASLMYTILLVIEFRPESVQSRVMVLSTQKYWSMGLISGSAGYYFIPENAKPDSSWIDRNVRTWFTGNGIRNVRQEILPFSAGIPMRIKIDSLNMVFSPKSDNLPEPAWQVILTGEGWQETVHIPLHTDEFYEIKKVP